MTWFSRLAFIILLVQCVIALDDPFLIPTAKLIDITGTENVYSANIATGFSQNAAGGKYIMTRSVSRANLVIYQRDITGNYVIYLQTTWPNQPSSMSTNGNWFGTLGGGSVDVFQINAGTLVNRTSFASAATLIQVLRDNSIVLLSNTTIDTYDLVNGIWTNIQSQVVNFTVTNIKTSPGTSNPDESVPHLTDTTLAAFNPITRTVQLFIRNTNKSWTIVDEVYIDFSNYRANRILWNGNDTVFVSDMTFVDPFFLNNYGRVVIYSKPKTSVVWDIDEIHGSSSAASQPGYLGYSLLQHTKDIIIVGAPSNNAGNGEILFLHKVDGFWQATRRIVGLSLRTFFGYHLMKNDYDVIVQWVTSNIVLHNLVPPCYMPIQATCLDVTVDTCQADIDQLYTIGDSCTNVRLERTRLGDSISTFSFSFSRSDYTSDTVYCNATVTCPRSPPVAPISVPVALPVSSPVLSPTAITPITAPVIAPQTAPVTSPVMSQPPTNEGVPLQGPVPLAEPTSQPISAAPISEGPIPVLTPTNKPVSATPTRTPTSSPSEAGSVTSDATCLNQMSLIAITVFIAIFSFKC